LAGRKMEDDVPEETKARRLQEIVDLQQKTRLATKEEFIGKTVEVLTKNFQKKKSFLRNSQSITVVFPKENYKLVIL
jgi:tRNA-2-methylthio-N6-dimethylallyladenosine synthase